MSQWQDERPTRPGRQSDGYAIILISGVAIGMALGNLALGIALGAGIGGAGLALSDERTQR